jgi:hypothetical protein
LRSLALCHPTAQCGIPKALHCNSIVAQHSSIIELLPTLYSC